MSKQKSLGQIAYEAYMHGQPAPIRWDDLLPKVQTLYERMAQAVARAVLRAGETEETLVNQLLTTKGRHHE